MFPLVASRPAIDRRMRAQWDICTSRYRTYNPVSCPSMLNITSKIERSVFLENITAMTHDIKQHYIHFTVPTSNASEGHSSNIQLLPMSDNDHYVQCLASTLTYIPLSLITTVTLHISELAASSVDRGSKNGRFCPMHLKI